MNFIYRANDNLVELSGLTNDATDAYVNDATVTVTLTDTDGVEIVGETWPLTMGYVSDSDGIYRATLEDTLSLTAGDWVLVEVDAVGDGLTAHWEQRLPVMDRDFDQ